MDGRGSTQEAKIQYACFSLCCKYDDFGDLYWTLARAGTQTQNHTSFFGPEGWPLSRMGEVDLSVKPSIYSIKYALIRW